MKNKQGIFIAWKHLEYILEGLDCYHNAIGKYKDKHDTKKRRAIRKAQKDIIRTVERVK